MNEISGVCKFFRDKIILHRSLKNYFKDCNNQKEKLFNIKKIVKCKIVIKN